MFSSISANATLVWYQWSSWDIYIFDENGVHLSEKRLKGIQDIPILTSVSAVRNVVVNYFRDFIPSLSSYLQPLTKITKKKFLGKWFPNDGEGDISLQSSRIKWCVPSYVQSSHESPLILYMDASTRAIEGVLKFKFNVGERSLVFSYRTRCQSK